MDQVLRGKKINWSTVAKDAGIGMLTLGVLDSKVGQKFTGFVGKVGNKVTPKWLKNGVKKANVTFEKKVQQLSDTGSEFGKRMKQTAEKFRNKAKDYFKKRKMDKLYKRTQETRDKIKQQVQKIRNSEDFKNLSSSARKKLEQKLRPLEKGNIAVADVNVAGIKKSYIAHSQIDSSKDLLAELDDFTSLAETRKLTTYVDDGFSRYHDTEAKILEDIAARLENRNIVGEIDLYSNFDVCQSCTNIILEFRREFPNIKLNVYTNIMR
ncbi:deaminase domain-containing protein [Paenibacillus antibioticophila]|uniref:deaminase domain-containing protein n=1 Tax=Paenibacillus antibioticophila TaxID=1274374 RepID=UPI000AAC7B20|nr:deaminase domain-containing protein [Paenibacillus antibioticophila]